MAFCLRTLKRCGWCPRTNHTHIHTARNYMLDISFYQHNRERKTFERLRRRRLRRRWGRRQKKRYNHLHIHTTAKFNQRFILFYFTLWKFSSVILSQENSAHTHTHTPRHRYTDSRTHASQTVGTSTQAIRLTNIERCGKCDGGWKPKGWKKNHTHSPDREKTLQPQRNVHKLKEIFNLVSSSSDISEPHLMRIQKQLIARKNHFPHLKTPRCIPYAWHIIFFFFGSTCLFHVRLGCSPEALPAALRKLRYVREHISHIHACINKTHANVCQLFYEWVELVRWVAGTSNASNSWGV